MRVVLAWHYRYSTECESSVLENYRTFCASQVEFTYRDASASRPPPKARHDGNNVASQDDY
jgi:hypothetical protein